MPERDSEPVQQTPPKRWHDGIRNNIPGNMMTENVFMSYSIPVSNDINLIVLSIIGDSETLPQGIYLITNIDQGKVHQIPNILRPMMDPIRKAILSQPDQNDQLYDIPAEVDPQLAAMGGKINMANTIGMSVVGVTNTGGIIFALKPQTFQNLKDNFRPSNI